MSTVGPTTRHVTSEKSSTHAQISPLLLLPAEIRDQILEYILLSPTGLIRLNWLEKKPLNISIYQTKRERPNRYEILPTRAVGVTGVRGPNDGIDSPARTAASTQLRSPLNHITNQAVESANQDERASSLRSSPLNLLGMRACAPQRQFDIQFARTVALAMKHGRGGSSYLRFPQLKDMKARLRIDVSLLRVCWQLYNECMPILWGRNIVDLGLPKLVRNNYQGWDVGPRPHIQHIAISYGIAHPPPNQYPEQPWILPLTELRKWEGYNNLKRVDLHIIPSGVYDVHSDYVASKRKMMLYSSNDHNVHCFEEELYEVWMKELRRASADEYLSALDIKVVARTGYDRLGRSALLFRLGFVRTDPNLHFQEVSRALGREVWVDGSLCYDDGKEIKVPFPQYYEAKSLSHPLEASIGKYLDSIGEERDELAKRWP